MIYVNDDQEDIILCLTIALLLLSFFGLQILQGGFNFIGFRNSLIPGLILKGTYYLFLILCIPIVMKRFTIDMLGIMLFFLVSICISYILYPVNQPYIELYVKDIINIFPSFFIARAIRNPKIFLDYLNKTAYVLFLFGMIYFLFYSMKGINRGSGYDMMFGYQLCIGVLILLNKWIEEKKKYDLIFFLAGIVMIVIKGSRGPILVLLIFLVLKFIYSQVATGKKIKYLFIIILTSTLVFIYQENIAQNLLYILDKFHIYSRNITNILINNLESIDERKTISTMIIEKIILNPLGYGVFSDRAILQGTYTHNVVLEMLLNFGWVIGSLALSGITLLIYFGLKNKVWTDLVIIFASYTMAQLMVSGSYLLLSYFWIMLGVVLNAVIQRKENTFIARH